MFNFQLRVRGHFVLSLLFFLKRQSFVSSRQFKWILINALVFILNNDLREILKACITVTFYY